MIFLNVVGFSETVRRKGLNKRPDDFVSSVDVARDRNTQIGEKNDCCVSEK